MERIDKLSNKELLDYLKFRRKVISNDEYISYIILLFMLWNINKFGIWLIILVGLLAFVGVWVKGYVPYWKLSNKYLVEE